MWKQITLPKRVVIGLRSFNSGGSRDNIAYDEKFIKVLLVVCIGVDRICLKQKDPIEINFIKGSKRTSLKYNTFKYLFYSFQICLLFVVTTNASNSLTNLSIRASKSSLKLQKNSTKGNKRFKTSKRLKSNFAVFSVFLKKVFIFSQ